MRCFSLNRRKTIIFLNLKWMQQDSSNLTPQQWGAKDPKTPAICRGLHSSSRIRTRRHATHTFNPHFFYCEEKNIFYVTNLNAPIYRPCPHPSRHSRPEFLKKSSQKKLVKSNKSKKFFREIAFLAVLNFFPVQKLIFLAIFEIVKNGFWSKKIS